MQPSSLHFLDDYHAHRAENAGSVKQNSRLERSDSTKWTTVLTIDEKKKNYDKIIHKLNIVTKSRVDLLPTNKLQNLLGQRNSINEPSFLDEIISQYGGNNVPNDRRSISKANFANTIINQEDHVRKILIGLEEQFRNQVKQLENYQKLYDEMRPDRLGQSDFHASFETDMNSRLSSGTKIINLTIKDAIYVLDPKFSSVVGTYLKLSSEHQSKSTSLVTDYLRPNWNEHMYFTASRDHAKVDLEFLLVERDGYETNTETVFGKASFMIDEAKGINNDISGWYPIYNIYNSQVEIGKINLVYEILSSEPHSLERIIQAKEAELLILEKNIINVKEELAVMQDFISPRDQTEDKATSRANLDIENIAGAYTQNYADVLMSYSPIEKSKYEVLKNYLVLIMIISAVINCFFRPDFLSLVVGMVLFFYASDNASVAFYRQVQIGLLMTILFDVIWMGHFMFNSSSVNLVFRTGHVGLPAFLTLIELVLKAGTLITLNKIVKVKNEETGPLHENFMY